MKDITVDGYTADGKVVKKKNEDKYDVVISVPFVYKKSAEEVLSEFAMRGLILGEVSNETRKSIS